MFQYIISSLAHAENFERFLSQTFTADGRDWTAGQFLYKHFFDQIPAFNAVAATLGTAIVRCNFLCFS